MSTQFYCLYLFAIKHLRIESDSQLNDQIQNIAHQNAIELAPDIFQPPSLLPSKYLLFLHPQLADTHSDYITAPPLLYLSLFAET